MQLTMSNPGLPFAMVGNPGPRMKRRSTTRRRTSSKGRKMTMTKKQARSLAKAWRARGMPVPAKIRAKLRNPGTAAGAAKSRRRKARKSMTKRRSAAKVYRKRLKGYKVIVRRRAGKRKSNAKWGRSKGVTTGRKGSIAFRKPVGRGKFKLVATNPRRRRARRNPGRRSTAGALSVKGWTGGLTGLPANLGGIMKGKVVKNALFASGGMIGSMMVGGMARGFIMSTLSSVAPALVTNRIAQGALGAAITYTGGYLVGAVLIKDQKARNSFIAGSAAAAILNAILPGQINRLITAIPVIGPQMAALPGMNGLGAYVMAPSYQGVGAYVSAPSYQGVGLLPSDAVAGYDDALAGGLGTYVSAPGYQGVGMYAASHLDQ